MTHRSASALELDQKACYQHQCHSFSVASTFLVSEMNNKILEEGTAVGVHREVLQQFSCIYLGQEMIVGNLAASLLQCVGAHRAFAEVIKYTKQYTLKSYMRVLVG